MRIHDLYYRDTAYLKILYCTMHIVVLLNCSLYPHLKEKRNYVSNFPTLTDNFFVSDLILLNLEYISETPVSRRKKLFKDYLRVLQNHIRCPWFFFHHFIKTSADPKLLKLIIFFKYRHCKILLKIININLNVVYKNSFFFISAYIRSNEFFKR